MFQKQQKNIPRQNRINLENNNYINNYNNPSQKRNLFEQQRNRNFPNPQENQINDPLKTSLQSYLNGKININTTNINQNIYNNNIYPNNNSNKGNNINRIENIINNNINNKNNINKNSFQNNSQNLGNHSNKNRRHNNNNFSESNSNKFNQINYNQLLNLKNENNNNSNLINNINTNQINNNDLELIKLKLLYLNSLNNNNNNQINNIIPNTPNSINQINNQNINLSVNPVLLEQLRLLNEAKQNKEYLLNLLQINNIIENNKKIDILNYLNMLNNQNRINRGTNDFSNFDNNNNINNINDNQNNIINNQNNSLINQLYRQLINNQLIENSQIQNPLNNNLNNNINLNSNLNSNNYQNNIQQQYNNNNDVNQILNDLQNNSNQNQMLIQNNFPCNESNQMKYSNNNTHYQKHKNTHISNSLNLDKIDNETIIKEAYYLTKGQIGCRFLQKKVEEDTKFALEFIYPIIFQHLIEIINDKFGNYLIQKFLEYLSQKEIFSLINSIKDNFFKIGLNQYGTRVIQKLLDSIVISENEYNIKNYKILESLIKPNILKFSNDLNGCHIIQNIIMSKTFPNKFLFEVYRENIAKVANDKNGCCFLQKCIDKSSGLGLNSILESIFLHIKEIIIDKYGNYVVQYIIKNLIDLNKDNQKNIKNFNWYEIFKFILDDFVNYSNQKYSSNVIEKLFTIDALKLKMIEKLKNRNITKNLLFEKYGNYVIQKSLLFAENKDRDELLRIIADLSEELINFDFGNKLLNKLTTKYPELINYIEQKNKNNSEKNEILKNKEVNSFKNNNIINNNINKESFNQNEINNSNIGQFRNEKKINKINNNNSFEVKK